MLCCSMSRRKGRPEMMIIIQSSSTELMQRDENLSVFFPRLTWMYVHCFNCFFSKDMLMYLLL